MAWKTRLPIDPDNVRDLYGQGLSVKQISQTINCSMATVYRRLLEAKAPMNKRQRIIVSCVHCGAQIIREPNQLRKSGRAFCGKDCYDKWQRKAGHSGPDHHSWGQVDVDCVGCGKSMQVPAYRAKAGRVFCSLSCRGDWVRRTGFLSGSRNGNWKGSRKLCRVTLSRRLRNTKAHRQWRAIVLERAEHCCEICGNSIKENEAHAHHIIPLVERPDLAYEPDNGMAVCSKCHQEIHSDEEVKAQ